MGEVPLMNSTFDELMQITQIEDLLHSVLNDATGFVDISRILL